MEFLVEKQFSEQLIHYAGIKFGANTSHFQKLGDFESYIFEVSYQGKPTILRLTHDSHRSPEQIEAEMHWVNYLHEHGVNVSKPFISDEGKFVVSLPVEDNFFYASLFEKAPGESIKIHSEQFNNDLFEEWGRCTGQLHRLTKNYKPLSVTRPNWDEEELLYPEQILTEPHGIENQAKQLLTQLNTLPINKESFGLIHSDIHSGNFFIHDGKIQVFDFDDAQYYWFIHDIAIPIYYSAWYKFPGGNQTERSEFANTLLESFLNGYEIENHLDKRWYKQLPLFLNVRDLVLYNVFHKKMDIPNASGKLKALLTEIKTRIMTGESIVKLSL